MQAFEFHSPASLAEFSRVLADTGGSVLAGGTDILPRLRRDRFHVTHLVDASRLAELRFIRREGSQVCMGAMTTHSQLSGSALIRSVAPALAEAAESVGCVQTRSRATLGGNIANASPAGDSLPPLLVLDAVIIVDGAYGTRLLRLADFLLGPGQTALRKGEYLHSVRFPVQAGGGQAFLKLGKRSGMAISVANVAALIVVDANGIIATARLALGSLAPVAKRSAYAEAVLLGEKPSEDLFKRAAAAAQADIDPISDVRASDTYRRRAMEVLVCRALTQASAMAGERGQV
jgi:CO/xanthine dehydrogenase FAD-binding subunit